MCDQSPITYESYNEAKNKGKKIKVSERSKRVPSIDRCHMCAALSAECFVLLYPVPDTAPANVGGGGGSKSELVITWEVSHLSVLPVPLRELMVSPN